MIIEFFVTNYRSIKNKQSFSLAKAAGDELADNAFNIEKRDGLSLLRSAAIYGANAAGKSNFIDALDTMKIIVNSSAKESVRGDSIPVKPFLLSKESKKQPTEFEAIFFSGGIKYQYGFSLTSEKIEEEWLFAYPKGRPQRWFIRAYDEVNSTYVWDFSSFFLGQKQLWKESTKANSLFLSTAVMLNSEQLRPVFDWFNKTLRTASINGWGSSYTAKMCREKRGKEDVLKFLKSADLDIDDLDIKTTKFDESSLPNDMPIEIKETILSDLHEKEFLDIKTVHKDSDGDDVFFDLEDESDGTRKLFSFSGPWIDSLKNGRVLFIDELHDSLHPNIVKFLIKLFNNKKTNPNNSQLVFTTHDTSILDQKVFRRDQIWFCNKEQDQSTTIYPLTDFSPRKGVDNLEKSYLSGRYGALPLVSNLEYLGGRC